MNQLTQLATTLIQSAAQVLGWRVANMAPSWLVIVILCVAALVYFKG
jgi:hypothetical protein